MVVVVDRPDIFGLPRFQPRVTDDSVSTGMDATRQRCMARRRLRQGMPDLRVAKIDPSVEELSEANPKNRSHTTKDVAAELIDRDKQDQPWASWLSLGWALRQQRSRGARDQARHQTECTRYVGGEPSHTSFRLLVFWP